MQPRIWCLAALALGLAAGAAEVPLAGAGERYRLRVTLTPDGQWPADEAAEIRFDEAGGAAYVVSIEATGMRLLLRRDQQETVLGASRGYAPITDGPLAIVLCRDPWRKRVIVNGQVRLTAFDDSLPPGDLVLRTESDEVAIGQPEIQPTEEVYFLDDFMRNAGEHGTWTPVSGKWELSGVSADDANEKGGPQADKSSNPFAFRATETQAGALATTGYWFWDNYRAETSVRADGLEGAVGLCFYVQDPSNYLAFRWHHAGDGAERQLVRVRDGNEELLASASGGWADEQWYRLGITVVDGHIEASIDHRPVLTADTDALGQGGLALWAGDCSFADFDDIQAETVERVTDTFARRTNGLWQPVQGEFEQDPEVEAPRGRGVIRPADGALAAAVAGDVAWRDYRVTATLRLRPGSGIGLLACYRDPRNYLAYRLGAERAPRGFQNQMVKVVEGQEQPIIGDGRYITSAAWHEVAFESRRGHLRTFVDGAPIWEVFDPRFDAGKAGVLAYGEVEVDQVEVSFLDPERPVEFTQQFTEERSMHEWAAAEGSWYVQQAGEGGVVWHRGDFYGDPSLAIDSALFEGRQRSIRLILDGDGENAGSGHSLVLTHETGDASTLKAQLLVAGHPAAGAVAPLAGVAVLKFVRRGWFVMGYADEDCFISFQLTPQTLQTGLSTGIAGTGGPVDLNRVNAWSDHLFDTTFVQAPWEWHIAKGRWETINRWKCDPRWSFFGGWEEPETLRSANPVIWTKEDYAGDIRVEAYMAIRMDHPNGPNYYEHPSDLSLSICGNGRELTSGYAFCFAGRRNTASLLYRDGKLVAENPNEEARFRYTGPGGAGLEEFHRHWFHVVLRRHQGRITCSVDDRLVFDVTDPQPIEGGKVAIFAVNNGVMVARAKVWYERLAVRQPFDDAALLLAGAERGGGQPSLANDFETGLGAFEGADARPTVFLERTSESGGGRRGLAVTNLVSGGTFGVRAVSERFQTAQRPRLRFMYRIPQGVRINAYVRARGEWHQISITGGDGARPPLRQLGRIQGAVADGRWHDAQFDLNAAFGGDITVEEVVFGMFEQDEYLHAGFGCNPLGSTWHLDEFSVGP